VGANIHARDDYSLRLSVQNGYLEVVKYLVNAGANIHARNIHTNDDLQWSAEMNI